MTNKSNWDPHDRSCSKRHPDRRWRAIFDRAKGGDNDKSMMCDPRAAAALWFCRGLMEKHGQQQAPKNVCPTDLTDISGAWRVFTRPEYRRTRDLLEACIYTPLSAVEIADRLNLQPAVVEWYEYLFYDIRRFLMYPLLVWSSDHLLGRLHTSVGKADESLLWKAVAYKVGADALFRLVGGPQSFVAEDWEWVSRAIRHRFAISTWEAAMGARPSNENALDLANLDLRLSKVADSHHWESDDSKEVANSFAEFLSDMAIKPGLG